MPKRNEAATRFHNHPYHAEVGHTEAGSPVIKIVPENPKGLSAHYRQVNTFIYELAAEMERRSAESGAEWVISPDSGDSRIVLELANGSSFERARADAFVVKLLVEWKLA